MDPLLDQVDKPLAVGAGIRVLTVAGLKRIALATDRPLGEITALAGQFPVVSGLQFFQLIQV